MQPQGQFMALASDWEDFWEMSCSLRWSMMEKVAREWAMGEQITQEQTVGKQSKAKQKSLSKWYQSFLSILSLPLKIPLSFPLTFIICQQWPTLSSMTGYPKSTDSCLTSLCHLRKPFCSMPLGFTVKAVPYTLTFRYTILVDWVFYRPIKNMSFSSVNKCH